MRLQKFLARAGAASRRGSENLMTAGRVTVNGQVVTELGFKVDPSIDEVRIDGLLLRLSDTYSYLMLNKPSGYLTTMDDPQGRSTVAELVPVKQHPGLFPVGRLDYDTTGLLLFMTNGELAYQLLHPRHKVEKRYLATVDGVLTEKDAEQLRQGVALHDGLTAPAKIVILEVQAKRLSARELHQVEQGGVSTEQTVVSCTITEGRKRQVKRMFAQVGHPVLELRRDAFGALELGDLAPGQWRYLTADEVQALADRTGGAQMDAHSKLGKNLPLT
jgi:23S rRNA pseudouridine2605 synthase